jgi:dTDP-4-amino-4,6-dideoxygalactose transaminase
MTTALALDRPISMLPVLRVADCIPTHASTERCVLDAGSPRLVARGAVAILLALRHARVGSGAEVLVPAFNCPSMIAPVRAAGAEAVPYSINEDLSVDLSSLERLITSRTRAMLVAHLLGRVGDLAPIKALCDARGIILIEDCAHAFFGATSAGPVGSIGHYAIASPRKFFPIAEGGLLTSATRDLRELSLPAAPWRRTVRSALSMIDTAVEFGHLRAFAPILGVARRVRSALRGNSAAATAGGGAEDAYDIELDVRQCLGLAGGAGAGRYLFNVGLVAARRRNFARLAAGIGGATAARVLDMPPVHTFVPYVVPVLLADPQRHFVQLKQMGVPMWRWEHSMRGVCHVTDRYSQSLIQLPCHQSLRPRELERIIDAVCSLR